MPKNDFSRTNVDVNSLNVSTPNRSSFDLSKNSMQTIPFGVLYPTRCTKIIPGSTIKGSVNPDLMLEKFATPAAGRMRLDTHTFLVAARRIHKDFKKFIESGITGKTALNLPSFTLDEYFKSIFETFYVGKKYTLADKKMATIFADVRSKYTQQIVSFDPGTLYQFTLRYIATNLAHLTTIPTDTDVKKIGNNLDFFQIESERLYETADNITLTNYFLGDFVYDVMWTLFGEGSTLDQLGYPIISYAGSIRERLNDADKSCRNLMSVTSWTTGKLDDYVAAFGGKTIDNVLIINGAEVDEDDDVVFTSPDDNTTTFFAVSEMPLRANYSVWFDYFRNWHLDKESSCLNPDDFGSSNLSSGGSQIMLLIPRRRNWSRDGFTMIQPDDVYRHVYAPASVAEGAFTGTQGSEPEPFDLTFTSVTTALFGGSSAITLPFPSTFTHLFGESIESSAYYHDIQTMRRAEMLKHKLTRDYYNPDTYVGQHFARYNVQPEDMSILCSKYLGGNETMISGSQQISNINNEDTDAGQRTLVANASSNDEYIYNTSEHAYLINYVSIVPLVHYDALEPTLQDLSVNDQVIPEFANDNQVMIRTCDLVRNTYESGYETGLGYVPRYYGHRIALDDVHGKYLREYRSYTWLRDHKNEGDSILTKNAMNEHINTPLDCFLGLKQWDTVALGSIDMPLFIECALPAKVENL